MGALRSPTGTPILAAETLVDRLEFLGRRDALQPETHRAILDRLDSLVPGLRRLAVCAPSDFPVGAVSDFAFSLCAQRGRASWGVLDAVCFERDLEKMRLCLAELRAWSSTAPAFLPPAPPPIPGRKVGRFFVIEGGRV